MALSKSLNAFISWRKILSLLEVTTEAHALPTKVLCPICNSHQLLIFPDNILDGQWHSCKSCGSHGDIIQLAAHCWKLSIPATVKKMIAAGVILPKERSTNDYIQNYKTNHVDLPITLKETLDKSFGNIQAQGVIDISRKYGWKIEGSSTWRKAGANRLVAGMHYSVLEALFWPNTYKSGSDVPGKYISNPSNSRIFVGRNWGDVLVIPYYDMPGRVCGITIIGRNADPDKDVLYKCTLKNRDVKEAGLAGHPKVFSTKGDTVFGFRDHISGVRLQMRHMGMKTEPLPLVLWRDDGNRRSRFAWDMFGNRKIIICDTKFSPEALAQAITSDGYMVTVADIDYGQPRETLQKLEENSKHWSDAFENFAETATTPELEELVYSLPRAMTRKIFDKISVGTKERLKSLSKFRSVGRVVVLGTRLIEEREDSWYWTLEKRRSRASHSSESLVADAVLRIDKVIYVSRSKKTYYQGRVKYLGTEYEFCVDRKKMTSKPFAWMQGFLLTKGKGLLRYSAKWEQAGIELALLFKAAIFVQGCDVVGWDDTTEMFHLPYYTISEGDAKRKEQATVVEDSPASHIQDFRELTPDEMERLVKPGRASEAFWANWCACVANILAPAFNHPTRGIAVVGAGAIQGMRQVARSLGCHQCEVGGREPKVKENEHNWPMVIGLDDRSTEVKMMQWVNERKQHKDVIVVSLEQALGLLAAGGWNIVVDMDITSGGATDKARDYLVTNYLSYIMDKKLINVYQGGELLDSVFDSVAEWVESHHVDATPVRNSRQLLSVYARHKTLSAFGRLLSRWYNSGEFEIGSKFSPDKMAWHTPDGVFVAKAKLLNLWKKKNLPRLDINDMTEHMIRGNVLIKESSLENCLGWIIDKTWWAENVQQAESPTLRVYEG